MHDWGKLDKVEPNSTTNGNTLHHTAQYSNTLRRTAKHCETLQNTATYCKTLPMFPVQGGEDS